MRHYLKASATKMPENWKRWTTAITDMQMRQRDVCCASVCKIHEELADTKLKIVLVDDDAAGRRRLRISDLSVGA